MNKEKVLKHINNEETGLYVVYAIIGLLTGCFVASGLALLYVR
jgi:hypothetical protein